jgi:hypothetical protein
MPTKKLNYVFLGVMILAASFFLIDRYYWAQISQWREDQAANLWLGYTRDVREIPVGLISSRKIPNPNGMPLLGVILSRMPNLLAISFLLGITQIVLIVLVGWSNFRGQGWYFLLATVPSLSSVILRSVSVEFWNQYTITLLNIFFIFWSLRYLRNGSLWNLPPIAILILLAPSLYLAGIVNAIIMTLLTAGILIYKRPRPDQVWSVSTIILLLGSLSLFLTWRPYFHNVSLEQIVTNSQLRPNPSGSPTPAFKHADLRILSGLSQTFLKAADRVYILQVVFALLSFFYLYFKPWFKPLPSRNSAFHSNASVVQIVLLSGSFIILSYAFAMWLGGADWFGNQRPDQTVQFLPLFLIFIFLLPFSVTRNGTESIIAGFSKILFFLFVALNLVGGFLIVRDHLQYRGDALTEADVPLRDKMQVVEFIAHDWKNHSDSNVVPVDYDLGGGKWDWVPEFGQNLTRWYPAPMTPGRSFDYELLRRYGLTNQQEGTQLRSFGDGRYLVTYAFEEAPKVEQSQVTHFIFGRLRVSLVEK